MLSIVVFFVWPLSGQTFRESNFHIILFELKKKILPEMANPLKPTARVNAMIAKVVLEVLPTKRRKSASIPNPPQLKIFLT